MERHLICEFVFDSWFQQHLLLVLIHQPKLLKEAWCTNRQPHPVCPPVALKGSASNKRRPWELSTSPPPTPFWTESKFRPILDGIEQNRFWELDPLMRSMWCSLIKWVFVKKKANSPWENQYPKAYLASLWKLKLHGRIFRKGLRSHGRRARGERSQGNDGEQPEPEEWRCGQAGAEACWWRRYCRWDWRPVKSVRARGQGESIQREERMRWERTSCDTGGLLGR